MSLIRILKELRYKVAINPDKPKVQYDKDDFNFFYPKSEVEKIETIVLDNVMPEVRELFEKSKSKAPYGDNFNFYMKKESMYFSMVYYLTNPTTNKEEPVSFNIRISNHKGGKRITSASKEHEKISHNIDETTPYNELMIDLSKSVRNAIMYFDAKYKKYNGLPLTNVEHLIVRRFDIDVPDINQYPNNTKSYKDNLKWVNQQDSKNRPPSININLNMSIINDKTTLF